MRHTRNGYRIRPSAGRRHGLLNGLHGILNVDDHALAQPFGLAVAYTYNLDLPVGVNLADDGADFRGAYVQPTMSAVSVFSIIDSQLYIPKIPYLA